MPRRKASRAERVLDLDLRAARMTDWGMGGRVGGASEGRDPRGVRNKKRGERRLGVHRS